MSYGEAQGYFKVDLTDPRTRAELTRLVAALKNPNHEAHEEYVRPEELLLTNAWGDTLRAEPGLAPRHYKDIFRLHRDDLDRLMTNAGRP